MTKAKHTSIELAKKEAYLLAGQQAKTFALADDDGKFWVLQKAKAKAKMLNIIWDTTKANGGQHEQGASRGVQARLSSG